MRHRRSRVDGHLRPRPSLIRGDEHPLQRRRRNPPPRRRRDLSRGVGIPPGHHPQVARDVDRSRVDPFGHGQLGLGPISAVRRDRDAADRLLRRVLQARLYTTVSQGLERGDIPDARIELSPSERRGGGQLLGSRVPYGGRGTFHRCRIKLHRQEFGRERRLGLQQRTRGVATTGLPRNRTELLRLRLSLLDLRRLPRLHRHVHQRPAHVIAAVLDLRRLLRLHRLLWIH